MKHARYFGLNGAPWLKPWYHWLRSFGANIPHRRPRTLCDEGLARGLLVRDKRKTLIATLIGVAILFAAAYPFADAYAQTSPTTQEDTSNWVARILTSTLQLTMYLFGPVLNALTSGVIAVSSYNDFINSLAVVNGWVVVRDVANMFFIVVLLIIAFGTILGQEEYHYKKLLPKLLLLAVLVNFSRTIVGVMIDFAQVVMLTFVNGYSAAAGGNFANLFQITELLKFSKDNCETGGRNPSGVPGDWQIFAAALLAFIMVLVSIITIFTVLAVLILRVIMLWLLIVLSPMAFLAGTFPQGQKYYTQWWDEFKNQVTVGPLLAFFLWLSLITVGGGNAAAHIAPELSNTENQVKFACSSVGSADALVSYTLGIMMLLAGVQMAQSMGGAISGVAGQAKGFATRGLKLGAKALGGAAAFGAGYAERKLYSTTGVGLNPMRAIEKFKAYSQRRKLIEEATGAAKAGASAEQLAARGGAGWGLLAVGRKAMGAHADFFEDYMGVRGIKRLGGVLAGGPRRAKEIRAEAEELKKDRTLMRTQGEQMEEENKVYDMDTNIRDNDSRVRRLSAGLVAGRIDLTDPKNLALAAGFLKNLKSQEKELREGGQDNKADMIKAQAGDIRDAMDAGGTFDFSGLDTDVKDSFEVAIDGVMSGLRAEIDKLRDKKIKVQADIDLVNRKGLVFATDDMKKARIKTISEEINDKERAAAFRTPPRAFYAAENFRAVEAEERKKMPSHSLEATEVVEQFQNAVQERNKVKAIAWLKKAAEDYNDNEIFNGLGYDGGYEGIEQFRKEVLVRQLGMTDQESMAHMSDINYINEEKGHYNASRMYAVENGAYRARPHEEQAAVVLNENMKKDSRKFCQNTNRLGYGYETPDGKYRIDKSGLGTIVALQGEMINRIGRGELNPSAMNKLAEAMDQLVELERKGLLIARDSKGRNLRVILQDFKTKGPLEEGISFEKLKALVGKI